MQPDERQLDSSTRLGLEEQEEEQHIPGSEGRRQLRAAAAKAIDRGKRVAEMILECNEDGEHGDDGERYAEAAGRSDLPGAHGVVDAEFVGEDDGSNGSLYHRKPIKTRWSAAEDTKLKQLVDVHGSGNWRVVSGRVLGVLGVRGVWRRGSHRFCPLSHYPSAIMTFFCFLFFCSSCRGLACVCVSRRAARNSLSRGFPWYPPPRVRDLCERSSATCGVIAHYLFK